MLTPARFGSADDLWAAFRSDPARALAGGQALPQVRHVVLDQLATLARPRLVLAGLDGVPYRWFRTVAAGVPGLRVAPMLSTVPSTSTTAWTSVLTGLLPAHHGIYGAALRLDGAASFLLAADPADPVHLVPPSRLARGADAGTLLDEIASRWGPVHALGFPGDLVANPLVRRWLDGTVVTPIGRSDEAYADPERLTDRLLAQVDERAGGDVGAVFAYANFDWYIHDHGLTAPLRRAVTRLVTGLARWRHRALVALVSDHGAVAQRPASDSLLADPVVLEHSVVAPGGAGRMTFVHPRPTAESRVEEHLRRRFADGSARVWRGPEFLATFHPGAVEPERVGAFVVVATGDRFPGAMPTSPFEHGGLERDEMLAFLAWFEEA